MTPEERAGRIYLRLALAAAALAALVTAAVIVSMVRVSTPGDEPANDWPEGVHKVWQVSWSDDVNPEPAAPRWLEVCHEGVSAVVGTVCERASYVNKHTHTETGKVWLTGVVRLNGIDDPPTVRARLLEEGFPPSHLSNEIVLQHGSMLIAPATPVPEPSHGLLLVCGLLFIVFLHLITQRKK